MLLYTDLIENESHTYSNILVDDFEPKKCLLWLKYKITLIHTLIRYSSFSIMYVVEDIVKLTLLYTHALVTEK